MHQQLHKNKTVNTSTPIRYKSPYASPRVTSLRQQVIAGHPATRLSPSAQRCTRGRALGDKMPERRVSEATINHRPPLPPVPSSISGRSQSLDGLLDDNSGAGVDDEGASDVVDGARSLEVLLDESTNEPPQVLRPPRREERSKSVDNYLTERKMPEKRFDSMPRTRSPSEQFCESETLVVDEARELPTVNVTATTHDTAYDSEEEGPRIEVPDDDEGDRQRRSLSTTPSTAMSRQNSTTSSELPERKKTFINRLGKRVRSMIKK